MSFEVKSSKKIEIRNNQIVNSKNKMAGITLIALVITIIVLLILAGISIATLTGENGILTQTNTAKIENRGASVKEARDLWKINLELDNETNEKTAKELKDLIADLVSEGLLTEDERDIIIGNEAKGIEAQYVITIGSYTIDFSGSEKLINFKINNYEFSTYEGARWIDFLQEFDEEEFLNKYPDATKDAEGFSSMLGQYKYGGLDGAVMSPPAEAIEWWRLYKDRKFDVLYGDLIISDGIYVLDYET